MMQVALLVVGLIVGIALGLGAGWYFWHPKARDEEERPERGERRSARYPRSHEPSTPPQHRPTPRPRPVTALHHPNPLLTKVDDPPRSHMPVADVSDPLDAPSPTPRPVQAPDPAPAPSFEYRPAPPPEPERPVSIGEPRAADRHLLNDLLETNRRLTADAELRMQREGARAREQPIRRERPEVKPPATAPADNDLLARHRKLEEDSRRMSRRSDER